MMRKILGVILAPVGFIVYIVALPLNLLFKFIGGVFYLLSNVMDWLYDNKWKVMVPVYIITVALNINHLLVMSHSSRIYSVIGLIIILGIATVLYKKLLAILYMVMSYINDFFDLLSEFFGKLTRLWKYAIDSIKGYTGLSEVELFKLTNTNYYARHREAEDLFLKKYGNKLRK